MLVLDHFTKQLKTKNEVQQVTTGETVLSWDGDETHEAKKIVWRCVNLIHSTSTLTRWNNDFFKFIECFYSNLYNGITWSDWYLFCIDDYVNKAETKFKFQCSDGSYVAGMYSDYDANTGDRVWRFECCQSDGQSLLFCFVVWVDLFWCTRFYMGEIWCVLETLFMTLGPNKNDDTWCVSVKDKN